MGIPPMPIRSQPQEGLSVMIGDQSTIQIMCMEVGTQHSLNRLVIESVRN
jgi:hypothetical protein